MKRSISVSITPLLVASIITIVASCSSTMLTPPIGPGTEYPCGINGVSCGNRMCCDGPNVVCGGPFSGCAVGECCYAPEMDLAMRAHHEEPAHGVPQRPEKESKR